ncbi:hypothetical protein MACH26_03530 [Planctobacterium marinum]|uniref:Uncharacterized protein n=1 Tax=Planctobacterium marinum TaxID=1631968 RepID=A0AA48KQ91_9ALTE|nr:hypothetical protein MACH26_03530 [Planctobacterium marinum]
MSFPGGISWAQKTICPDKNKNSSHNDNRNYYYLYRVCQPAKQHKIKFPPTIPAVIKRPFDKKDKNENNPHLSFLRMSQAFP